MTPVRLKDAAWAGARAEGGPGRQPVSSGLGRAARLLGAVLESHLDSGTLSRPFLHLQLAW